jgi:SAM-dependent methyltransferase
MPHVCKGRGRSFIKADTTSASASPPIPSYLAENVERWTRGYDAECVDHPVFRFYGRILKVDGPVSGRLLDFGCGRGAAVGFFLEKGYDAYGVDISEPDLAVARERIGADHFALIDPAPREDDVWFGGAFDVIVAVQSLYYLGESALQERLESLHAQLAPGGTFYATMMGTRSWYFERSEPSEDGMRAVRLPQRVGEGVEHVLFTESHEHLRERFAMFEPRHEGFYSEAYRSGEGAGFHFTFAGLKR